MSEPRAAWRPPVGQPTTLEALVDRARALASPGVRRVLGITGAPGAGKSTLANALACALGDEAVLVTMDGFHLANNALHSLGRRDRKGAPDTFDVDGYTALLARLREQRSTSPVIYAPVFDRSLDESVGSAVPVDGAVPLIITEGNYLLYDALGWERVGPLLDESWFIAPSDALRKERLIKRHQRFGLELRQAEEWALGTDQRNAELIEATRAAADAVFNLVDDLPDQSDSLTSKEASQ